MAAAASVRMIDDNCDYCFRDFGRMPGQPAICVNCGLENVRPTIRVSKEILSDARLLRETSMLSPAVEKAIIPGPTAAELMNAPGTVVHECSPDCEKKHVTVTMEEVRPRKKAKKRGRR